jgi:hypothetical protein
VQKPTGDGYIDWDRGREGYLESRPTNTVIVSPKSQPGRHSIDPKLASIRREERFGSLVAAAGVIWAVYFGTQDYAGLWHLQLNPPGPLEICALGILAWLHAKWRRSLKV